MTRPDDGLRGLADAAEALAGELTLDAVLQAIAAAAARATGARYAALGVIGEDETISRFVHHGIDDATAREIGHLPRGHGLLGLLIRDPRIVRLDEIADHPASYGFPDNHPPMGAFLGAPVRSGGRVYGNLYLTEKDGGFDEHDEDLVGVLAAQAGAAIENAVLAERLQSMAVQDERDRISRELHDGVIQTVFSIGMGLESTRALVGTDPDRVESRIDQAVDALDGVIRQLRNYIFQLRPQHAASMGLSRGITELAREHEVNALVRPHVEIRSGTDARVPAALVPDLLQVVREALSNAAKHAQASTVTISAAIEEERVVVEVADDGRGFAEDAVRVGRGIDNMRERAEALGAQLEVASGERTGTRVRLVAPLPRDDEEARWSG
jgi:signal transduction histidine kinase